MKALSQPYNIAGLQIKTIEQVIFLSHFLITNNINPKTPEGRAKHLKAKQDIRDSINAQFDGKDPIEATLLFSANFDSYKPNEQDDILGELIKDLRNFPKTK